MLNFDFFEKGLEIFCGRFFHKNVSHVMLYYLSNFIVLLPLFCGILGNMFIVIVCFTGFNVINFEINLIFLIKPFFIHD